MSELAEKKCLSCQSGVPPLEPAQQQALLAELNDWQLIDQHHLHKAYSFKNFAEALNWVHAVSVIAEQENHHPDIAFGWGYVKIDIWTHKIDALTESDFVLAAKLDLLEI